MLTTPWLKAAPEMLQMKTSGAAGNEPSISITKCLFRRFSKSSYKNMNKVSWLPLWPNILKKEVINVKWPRYKSFPLFMKFWNCCFCSQYNVNICCKWHAIVSNIHNQVFRIWFTVCLHQIKYPCCFQFEKKRAFPKMDSDWLAADPPANWNPF